MKVINAKETKELVPVDETDLGLEQGEKLLLERPAARLPQSEPLVAESPESPSSGGSLVETSSSPMEKIPETTTDKYQEADYEDSNHTRKQGEENPLLELALTEFEEEINAIFQGQSKLNADATLYALDLLFATPDEKNGFYE